MQQKKLAFIGAGNMSRSIISGLIQSGYDKTRILASNPSTPKLDKLKEEFGIQITQSNDEACQFADAIVLAVKPQMMGDMCADLQQNNDLSGKLFLSIAAGLPVSRLQEMLGGEYPVVRIMPNTPSLLSKGMSGMYADNTVSEDDRTYVDDVMNSVGETVWVEEEDGINGVIAAAGSSPAYFFLFLQAMQDEAINMGFDKAQSRLMVQQAMLGAAEMVCHNPDLELSELRAQVTSKGGTTAAAVNTLIDQGLSDIVSNAMRAAVARAEEMAKQL
ncbi:MULTISPECIES: pyrroline-5-carboxylate reductase [Alteromonas]|jgi:pyrroline-5-carboxylate reductase|uniref:Pyrroline-5-carboxylate reductase n=1 Tax=Alteromonas stellipolaris TaxID=233316 RepID=A0AAW7Z501_9ALTE|nr:MULTISPECIES: pyrroline-5-carboxylate reductase [Alteromonas]AMJ91716.1 pyrroline-5-carboxylate reductase [Alteromonas sp. Mac2]ALM89444.1 Pyrroline-5-carboxylate reductase [Alteromonas stellipolaris LMG 21856]AMJ75429.1 pyrroline-5-carboxylate reductase [Alteromonas stellipolaris]AMJ87852.1 pyrroline-5-carboxylate reductase [Alteromonas sp. Mac1]ANB21437.1 pyrroline-5-carboxylate reductase [Alteromonas stellipolaris]